MLITKGVLIPHAPLMPMVRSYPINVLTSNLSICPLASAGWNEL